MKKLVFVLMLACMLFAFAACDKPADSPTDTTPPEQSEQQQEETETTEGTEPEGPAVPEFEGKIAVVTNTVSQNEEEYRSAEQLIAKYGADKVIHQTWPDNFMNEQEQMVTIVQRLASDPEVRILILNQAVPGSNPAVDKLHETRDDIFVVYATPQENPVDVAQRANLVIIPNELAMGPLMVQQAAAMGAKVFVHYSFPRHMSQVLLSGRRALMMEECEKLGIEFVDATAPDPTSDVGTTGAQQFILEDVPKMIAQYGKDTAFFSTNCAMQVPLITKVVEGGAIFPQPCCPSPYHGFPGALGIATSTGDGMATLDHVIAETTRILDESGELGRVSTWPAPASMMVTGVGAAYGIKWVNGEVPADTIDYDILKQCMIEYTEEYAGVAPALEVEPYEEDGTTFNNFVLILMEYLTYSE